MLRLPFVAVNDTVYVVCIGFIVIVKSPSVSVKIGGGVNPAAPCDTVSTVNQCKQIQRVISEH